MEKRGYSTTEKDDTSVQTTTKPCKGRLPKNDNVKSSKVGNSKKQ